MLPNEVQWGAVGGVIVAFIAGVFTWFTQRSKGRVEESIAAVNEWQKLTSNLSAANEALRDEITAKDKAHVEEVAEMRRRHEAELKALRTMNENLLRIISQNASSKAHLLGSIEAGSSGK